MSEVPSLENFVVSGTQKLSELAKFDNSVACKWLAKVEEADSLPMKLSVFGDMRIALMQESSSEAKQIAEILFPVGR